MKTINYDESKWQLVPIEPTREMRHAAQAAWERAGYVKAAPINEIWFPMLSAAPTAPEEST